jgi:DNA-binding GntR family transcriptional regulator
MSMLKDDEPNGTSPLDDPPIEERIARSIEQEIVVGQLAPRQKLREEDLAARFGASRHQVRQGLARLERIGIVTRERNRGASVRSFSANEVGQIYQIREILQRNAALRIPLPAHKADIAALNAIELEYEAAIKAGDIAQMHASNDLFHCTLFRLCGNELLVQLVKRYMDLSYAVRASAFYDTESLKKSAGEHNIMIALLDHTDSWSLSQICVDHIMPSKTHYLLKLTSRIPISGRGIGTLRKDGNEGSGPSSF